MDKFYRGSAFALDVRYAQVLNTVFVTMMYGAGIPLLLPVCAVTLALTFLLDKYMLLYFYNTDLLDCLNGDLALSAARLLPYVKNLLFKIQYRENLHFLKFKI